MFRKKQEDDWIIADEDFYETEVEPTKTQSKPKIKTKIKSKKEKQSEDEYYDTSDDYYDSLESEYNKSKRKPNPLRKRSNDDYSYDSFDDYVVEMEEPKKIERWKIVVPTLILAIISLGVIGYMNTDFDNNGNAYIVPLEIHYERAYTKEADELLSLILEINKTIDTNSSQLPSNFVTISAELNEEMTELKAKTTDFSKYVGVPTKFESYHSQLINFSLSTQTFINTLIENYNDANYEAFRQSGLSDYYNSLEKVKQARTDIDNIIFRNMEVDNELE